MRRPTKERVIEAIRRDHETGRRTYIEAVELDSGVMVVEYLVRSRSQLNEVGYFYQRRVITQRADNNPASSFIAESWFTEE